jgi:phosphatidate cytidylyltransferase
MQALTARTRSAYENAPPMLIRIVSGLIGAAIYIYLVFAAEGLPFALTVALFSVVGASELFQAVKTRKGGSPNIVLGWIACIAFQYAAWTHYGARFAPYLPALLILLVIVSLLCELIRRSPQPILNIGTTLLGAVYVGWLSSYVTLLHGIHLSASTHSLLVPPIAHTTPGEWIVLFVTVCTFLSDTGALFIGRGLGRHKMAPNISPGKTWEGSLGGLLCSVVGGGLFGWWLHLPLSHTLILAFLCGASGQIGDLCESALKRDLGIKDFGVVIPGHGGILDRIDSMLFSAPLAYYYFIFFLIARH